MTSTGARPERTTADAQVLSTLRQLLGELGGSRGLEELDARGASARLERQLGLGSLERVELMLRLGDAFGARLPDRVVAEAETVQDLIDAIEREKSSVPSRHAEVETTSPLAVAAAPARTNLEARVRDAATLTEVINLRGRGEPGRVHIQLYEEDDKLRAITFGELHERASQVSSELLLRGLEPAQTVALMLPTCAEFFYSFAGILLAGGIPVPIYPPFRADRIAEYATRQANILRNAEAQFLITFRQAEGLARALQPRVPTLREVLTAERLAAPGDTSAPSAGSVPAKWRAVQNLGHQARGEDIAFLQYTSGSTGDPKGVTLTHANLLANIRSIMAGVDVRPEDVAVSWLPLYHDMGLIGAWFVPLFSGNPLVLMSPISFLSRPERWLRAIQHHRGTVSPAPNFAYELCVRKIRDKDLEGLDLSSWRVALNGAEPVRPETLERFAARFAPYGFRREAMCPVYGLAEASLAVSAPKPGTGYKLDRIERETFESAGRAVPVEGGHQGALEFVSAGKPLPDVEVRITASDGSQASERIEGHLWFRGPSTTSGYYRNAAATATLLREDGWLDSGDLAYIAEGEIYITGRAKDVIIKGGRNIYPHEIEEVAGRVPGVRPGCVVAFGAPDPKTGTERLIVTAEVRNPADGKSLAAEIQRVITDAVGLPPDHIEILPPQSTPKTSSGKLRRGETRRLFLAGQLGRKLAPPWWQIAKLATGSAVPRAWSWIKRGVYSACEFVYGVYVLLLFLLLLIPLWAAVHFTRDRVVASRLVQIFSRLMLFAAGYRLRVDGLELTKDSAASGPLIFAPNHSSLLDILVTTAVLPVGVRFVAKGEVPRMPIIGAITRRTGQLAFDRADAESRIRQAQEVNAALARGESVVIFPEGTFTRFAGIRPFQLGPFKAAVESQRKICPVSIHGARKILRDWTYLPRWGSVKVTLGPLLTPQSQTSDDWREIVRLRDETREIIARNSGEPLL